MIRKQVFVLKNFHGGIHPKENKKQSRYFKIEDIAPPSFVVLPLSQHIGIKANAVVAAGQTVLQGQKIAEANGNISANIHSPISGVVEKIAPHLHPNGSIIDCVFIKNDFKNTEIPNSVTKKNVADLSSEEIVSAVREAGIVGMGGAAFPTHVKLTPSNDKPIKTVIINGTECEPYLTADYRAMLEYPEKIVMGALAISKALGATEIFMVIEDNKKEAIETLKQYASALPAFNIVSLPTRYPQGSEKHIIYAIKGVEVPPGTLPADVGCIVDNVSTCVAINDCLEEGTPLTHRIVTVAGDAFSHAQNYRVPIGTPISHIVEQHGGFSSEPNRILLGGPMMGFAQVSLDVPIIKGTGALLALSKKEVERERETACIRCGRCVDGCPMRLRPINITNYVKRDNKEGLKKENIVDCIECGCCSYNCPAKIHLLQWIKKGKGELSK